MFDQATGLPIEGAEVRDMLTGLSALTTPTTPVTVALAPAGQVLPAITTTAHHGFTPRGPADTVPRLEFTGFYDRRITTGAPSSAFGTGESLEKKGVRLLADLAAYPGRPICNQNLYIDGVRVSSGVTASAGMGPGRVPRNLKTGLADQLLQPSDVVGIENYSHVAEIPAEYNMTKSVTAGCATLIWTK